MIQESVVESVAMGLFEAAGYDIADGPNITGGDRPLRRSTTEVVLLPRLYAALRRNNSGLTEQAIEDAVRVVTNPPSEGLARDNRWFHALLTDGVEVDDQPAGGAKRRRRAWLLHPDDPFKDDHLVVSQLTVQGEKDSVRPDITVFLNGLPISVIELKNPTREDATVQSAWAQLQRYKEAVPALFTTNGLLAVSDGDTTRVGSLTAGWDRFMPWRSALDQRRSGNPGIDVLIGELFEPAALRAYLTRCVTFAEDGRGRVAKIAAGWHQFRAVRNASASVRAAMLEGNGKGGVVWHTQGSGKSLTMLMLTGVAVTDSALDDPTVIVVTDRNDLDDQLFRTFAAGRRLLRQEPVRAESRNDLEAQLSVARGGIVFTTMQKFEDRGVLCDRRNVLVMADEAHRSQYGMTDGAARWMRDALPNATYIAFTGTPLSRDDKNTRQMFGEYVDVYDVKQAVADGATVPIYYEPHLIRLVADDDAVEVAEALLADAAQADESGEGGDVAVPLAQLVGSPARLEKLAGEVLRHWDERAASMDGKAMIVGVSRDACMDLHDLIAKTRPEWISDDDTEGVVKVVMHEGVPEGRKAEAARFARHGRTKARREKLGERFKDPDDPLRLVIVCDMWLTGFDAPPVHTMYLDKPLGGHNLMQAIARVNRVNGDKPGGLVVDFLGVADELREAVRQYSVAGGEGAPYRGVEDEAVPEMQRLHETLRDFFGGHGAPAADSEEVRLSALVEAADHVLGQDDGRTRFFSLVTKLSAAFALAVPREETKGVRDDLAFWQEVRAAISKRLSSNDTSANGAAVKQVLNDAVAAGDIIDLFEAAGLPSASADVLSDAFLDYLGEMPQKNLAFEALKKLLGDQIRARREVHLVQGRSFGEVLQEAIGRYNNRAIDTAAVIDELLQLARTIKEAMDRGTESGLTEEEQAFYEALADNESARRELEEGQLKIIARDLTERIRNKAAIDWTKKDAVRADMRRTVRRLLAKYGYPPDATEAATELVIEQAETLIGSLNA